MVFARLRRNKMDPAKRRNDMEGRPERFSGLMGSPGKALMDLIQDEAGPAFSGTRRAMTGPCWRSWKRGTRRVEGRKGKVESKA